MVYTALPMSRIPTHQLLFRPACHYPLPPLLPRVVSCLSSKCRLAMAWATHKGLCYPVGCNHTFLTGHFCTQAWSLLSRTGSICPLPTPQGETRPQDSGWGQSLEPGREPLTEGRSSPLRPEASIQSLLQQRNLLNRA